MSAVRGDSGSHETAPLLELRAVNKVYGTGEARVHVLKDLTMRLMPGEMTALLGVSGSGKSTLLNILGTLLRPTSGSFTMLGAELFGAPDAALTEFRNRHVGFVFQFHNLLPDFTALENVIFPSAVRDGLETAAARARGAELLAQMGLADRIHYRDQAVRRAKAACCGGAGADEPARADPGRRAHRQP